MGLFGGIGKALKGIDWDRVSTGLSAAGASAHGEHGQAAQIWGQRRERQDRRAESEAEKIQRQQLEAAAVKLGMPPEQASSLPTGALAGLVTQQYTQQADNEFTRTLKAANIDPNSDQGRALYAQRAATMAAPAPQLIGSPERGYEWRTPPPPEVPGLTGGSPSGAQEGQTATNPQTGEKVVFRNGQWVPVNEMGIPESNPVRDQFTSIYGPVEGRRRYESLIRQGGQ